MAMVMTMMMIDGDDSKAGDDCEDNGDAEYFVMVVLVATVMMIMVILHIFTLSLSFYLSFGSDLFIYV